ncbi:hypothetical protein CPB83DRAFT_843335 [Crepidotus variabilis]|uniref:NTF2-like protein n=1 Tax=Crepidotus variabilis TaxID=179855 RepID=A0A9P6ERZ9_9AGAR|nr:hypothetical protein CPB83DRAFT_843335 [Crepidotus variabilis]
MKAYSYHPCSENEQPVPIPSAPAIKITENILLQPPLSRRGTGPGLILFLSSPDRILPSSKTPHLLDPEPTTKWAEEGYGVTSITGVESSDIEQALTKALDALQNLEQVDTKDKFGVIVYEPKLVFPVSEAVAKDPRLVAYVGYGSFASPALTIPITLHLTANAPRPVNPPSTVTKVYTYYSTSAFFVLPQSSKYDPGASSQAHNRTLAFIRKALGGPTFDLDAIWEEHCYYEFELKSLAKTMATMVAEPYVNHIPTMTGGIGREQLTAFYRDHFIFANPDVVLQPISRTVGLDRVVDEFVFELTHDRVVDWLLPGVQPTGKKLLIPMTAIVAFRGDRLYNEHIHWDQATVLRQAGILPTHLPLPSGGSLRLPVAGVESAEMLSDPSSHNSNEMMSSEWIEAKTT